MMTLLPPVNRGGDMLAILVRVVEGQIEPPLKRAPERAKAGWIPSELSAIAMKALGREPEKRYQTVEALRRDVELFLEGRSVSAKQDSFREMVWKLVKRNKGASIATAAALVVLVTVVGFFLKINYDARRAAEKANVDYLAEQDARRAQGKNSAPFFLEGARQSALKKKLDIALTQVNVALDFDPELADAWLLKGQLQLADKKFDEAQKSLTSYLQRQPGDANAKKLVELCGRPNLDDAAVLMEFSETLVRQKALGLAEVMIGYAGDIKDVNRHLFKPYQGRLDAAWPGSGAALSIDGNGKMSLNLQAFPDLVRDLVPLQGMKLNSLNLTGCRHVNDLSPLKGMPLTFFEARHCPQVTDLSALKGMPLSRLHLFNCPGVTDLAPLGGMKITDLDLVSCGVVSLSPLKGMPLTRLSLSGCTKVSDLTPLEGMNLTILNIADTQTKDLSPLKGMSLKQLNMIRTNVNDLAPLEGMPLPNLDLTHCGNVKDLAPLKGMPLTSLVIDHCKKVTDLAPLKGMALTSLSMKWCENVVDLAPVEGMKLTTLSFEGCIKIKSLAPLRGMKLTSLILVNCQAIGDLSPLQGMPFQRLEISGCKQVTDLSPLKGLELTYLVCDGTSVFDLSPLKGMKLTELYCRFTKVADLSPLQGMPLNKLGLRACEEVKDLSPLKQLPLTWLHMETCKKVTDLSPLEGMKLEYIYLPPTVSKGLDVLRTMSSLKTISDRPAAQFWKEHDAAKGKN